MRRFLLLTAVSFLLASCARTYRVATPEVVERGAIRVAVDQVRSAMPYANRDLVVSLRSGARAATSLRGASLSRASDPPCQSGKAFSEITADGVEQTEGPLNLAGSHRLELAFVDATRKLPPGPVALDLQFGSAAGSACARVPLFGTADSPRYQLDWRVACRPVTGPRRLTALPLSV